MYALSTPVDHPGCHDTCDVIIPGADHVTTEGEGDDQPPAPPCDPSPAHSIDVQDSRALDQADMIPQTQETGAAQQAASSQSPTFEQRAK